MSLNKYQTRYLDYVIKNPKIIRAISSSCEYNFKKIMVAAIGKEGVDWFHQHPFVQEDSGLIAVADFFIPSMGIVIELDGINHRTKKQVEKDIARDKIFNENNVHVLRIKTPLSKDEQNYWKIYLQNIK